MSLYKYLQEPFGPYPENVILSSHWKKYLNLRSLRMECGSSPVGLDETEFIAAAPKSSRIIQDVTKFYGIIEIASLECLSPQGQKYLQQELHRRLVNFDRSNNSRYFTLSDVHRVVGISVWLQCIKSMNARFLSKSSRYNGAFQQVDVSYTSASNGFETSLVINSETRLFNVLSLDVATFRRSRNFLTRWRLWALIEKLILDDPMETSIEERTIDWLVDQYFFRLQKNNNERFPRHVSRAEIIGIFAAHADWILAQHLATAAKAVQKLNIQKWISFCREVKSARYSASQQPVSLGWGLPEDGEIEDDIFNFSRFGTIGGDWDKKLSSALKKRPKKVQLEKLCACSPSATNSHQPTIYRHKPTTEFVYDSDFSEASTSSYSECTDEDITVDFTKIDEKYFYHPRFHSGYFGWQCHVCDYAVDFLDLLAVDDQNMRGRRTCMVLKGEDVQTAFFDMIRTHFASHIGSF